MEWSVGVVLGTSTTATLLQPEVALTLHTTPLQGTPYNQPYALWTLCLCVFTPSPGPGAPVDPLHVVLDLAGFDRLRHTLAQAVSKLSDYKPAK